MVSATAVTRSLEKFGLKGGNLHMARHMLALAVVLATRAALATDVTQCGQVIAPRDTGILRNDLVCGTTAQGLCADCAAFGCTVRIDLPCTTSGDCASLGGSAACLGVAVHLGQRATLEMDGFSISAVAPGQLGAGVFCDATCKVRGPGTISGAVGWGVKAYSARVFDLMVHDNFRGISTIRLRLFDTTTTANALGGEAYTMSLNGGAATGNSPYGGLVAHVLRAKDFTASNNATDGFSGDFVSLTRVVANGNGLYGAQAARTIAIRDSTLTGNGTADIASGSRPRLINTTCGTSAGGPGGTWGVCSGD